MAMGDFYNGMRLYSGALGTLDEIPFKPPSEELMRAIADIPALQGVFYSNIRPRGEVENLRAELAQRTAERNEVLGQRDAARAELATALTIIENDTRLIVEQAAEIAALRAAAAFKAPEPERPVLKPNPFREFPVDRRRIGG